MRMNASTPESQAGLTLTGLILTLIVVALVAVFGMRVVPDVIEYGKIVSNLKAVANDPNLKQASVAEVRRAFASRVTVDNIDAITPQDVEVTKEGGQLVLSVSYSRRIKMAGPVSLVIDFEGTSAK